jgi:hypothetical protein
VTALPETVAIAVIVVVPGFSAVTRPEELTVATFTSLELQATWFVRSSLAPVAMVPIAMNWPVSLSVVTAWVAGMIAREVSPPAPPEAAAVTVMLDVPTTVPKAPWRVAEIGPVPGEIPLASPVELIVAMAGVDDCHVAWSVTSCVVLAWLDSVYVARA